MNDIDHIIINTLNGEASQEELTRLEAWINLSPQNDQVFQKLLDFWYHNPDQESAQQIWRRVLEKEGLNPETEELVTSVSGSSNSFIYKFRYQLVAALAILFSTISFWGFPHIFSQKVTERTTFGEQREIILPDQTKVILNANSQISYHKNFDREVWLEGEAFFSVTPRYETQETFWVHTKDLSVKVLGTSFNINSFQEKTEVYLEEGKIELNLQGETTGNEDVFLKPGELLVYSAKEGGEFDKKSSKAIAHTSWKDGAAILENAPLGEILSKMEEIYGVDFEVKKKELLTHKYTIGVPVEDLNIAIEALEKILTNRTIDKKDNVFFIE